MKKSVILAILGLTAATVASYGQGAMAFNTYSAQGGSGIQTTYGNGGSAGAGINNTFTGELLWQTANPNDPASTAATAGAALLGSWTVGQTATFDTPPSAGNAGYIEGSNLSIAAAVGTTIYCELVAFNGTAWNTGSTYQGHSASFLVTLATGTTLPDPSQWNNMAAFSVYQVSSVPEPTTMALGGLGLAALLVARRKKA